MPRLILRRILKPNAPPSPPEPVALGDIVPFGKLSVGDWFYIADLIGQDGGEIRYKDTPDTCVTEGYSHTIVHGVFCGRRHPMRITERVLKVVAPPGATIPPI